MNEIDKNTWKKQEDRWKNTKNWALSIHFCQTFTQFSTIFHDLWSTFTLHSTLVLDFLPIFSILYIFLSIFTHFLMIFNNFFFIIFGQFSPIFLPIMCTNFCKIVTQISIIFNFYFSSTFFKFLSDFLCFLTIFSNILSQFSMFFYNFLHIIYSIFT